MSKKKNSSQTTEMKMVEFLGHTLSTLWLTRIFEAEAFLKRDQQVISAGRLLLKIKARL